MNTLVWLGENNNNVSRVSYKIYQLKLHGTSVYVSWGPVSIVNRKVVRGHERTLVTEFYSAALARKAHAKLLESKLRKGYVPALPSQIPA